MYSVFSRSYPRQTQTPYTKITTVCQICRQHNFGAPHDRVEQCSGLLDCSATVHCWLDQIILPEGGSKSCPASNLLSGPVPTGSSIRLILALVDSIVRSSTFSLTSHPKPLQLAQGPSKHFFLLPSTFYDYARRPNMDYVSSVARLGPRHLIC